MRIAMGADHAGFHLKEHVKADLEAAGHGVIDVGTASPGPVDYPQYAAEAAQLVAEGSAEAAVIACGSGVGVSIVANKVDGVRAVNAHDPSEAEMSRRHNDANVVTLSGARLSPDQADAIVAAFLRTDFEGGRHARRVGQIEAIEACRADAIEACRADAIEACRADAIESGRDATVGDVATGAEVESTTGERPSATPQRLGIDRNPSEEDLVRAEP